MIPWPGIKFPSGRKKELVEGRFYLCFSKAIGFCYLRGLPLQLFGIAKL